MTFEELIGSHVTAMNRLAAAIETNGVPLPNGQVAALPATTVAEPPKTTRAKPEKPAPTGPTHDDALAIAKKLAAKTTKAVVANLVFKHGGKGKRVSDIPTENIAAFITSAEVMLNEPQKQEDEEDDDDI